MASLTWLSGSPSMLCVLPEPVCPYANIVELNPEKALGRVKVKR